MHVKTESRKNKQLHKEQVKEVERMQTSEEAQPLGQDVSGFGLDQDLPAEQSHTGAHLSAHVKHARLLLLTNYSSHINYIKSDFILFTATENMLLNLQCHHCSSYVQKSSAQICSPELLTASGT